MSAAVVGPYGPPKDASKLHIAVNTNTTRGVPAKDIRLTNLHTGKSASFGFVGSDLSVSSIAVEQILSGQGVAGNNLTIIARV